jgi:restriction system protein
MSLLDTAYEVLKKSGSPMTPADIIRPIIESGMWTTKGKTPEQTLGARLYVDIKKLGTKSRFANVGNGRFALSGVKAEELPAQAPLPGFGVRLVVNGGKTYSFTDCAEKVLKAQGGHKPMHYLDITQTALSKGWLKTSGQTPEATMYTQIIQEIQRLRKRGEVPRFVQCGKGLVALTAWDKAGVDFQVQQHHEDVRKKLKAKLMALKPEEFEELISRLFREIGFREVSRTRLSGDGGIDVRGTMVTGGVISTELAIQAKRWKRNVQAPIVQQVRGSLGAHEQGCIVTTSDFSAGAREEAHKMDKAPIALIDGKELINLMLEYEVGVRRKEVPLFEVQDNLLNDVDEDR